MKILFTLLTLFICIVYNSSGQNRDSISVFVKWGPESQELKDYHRFEEIDYYKVNIQGKAIKNKHYLIIAKEYSDKALQRVDTLVNTKKMGLKIESDKFDFAMMSRKTDVDSVKMQLFFSNFGNVRKFATLNESNYGLLDPSNGKRVKYSINKPFTLFAYSLPYTVPERPDFLYYCELSKNGTPPERWGEVFNIRHYITLDMVIE